MSAKFEIMFTFNGPSGRVARIRKIGEPWPPVANIFVGAANKMIRSGEAVEVTR